jgi:sterol desaturase/sphingolipid hydroxylase (fatty acid hydroxylase superfamily)
MRIEAFVQTYGETLQYLLYFGLLVLLGMLEAVAPGRRHPAERRWRWPPNFVLTVLNILALGALPVTGVGIAALAQERGWGLLNRQPLPLWVTLAIAIVTRSLSSYAVHVAMHKVPLLWRVHRVHHTDTAVDVSTTVRFHPLEFLIQVGPTALVLGLLGLPPWTVIAYELLDTATNLFIHANVRVPAGLDRWLRQVLVTPDLHRIHHSARWPETDRNYGVVVPWWDRLFGTYQADPARGSEDVRLGLEEFPAPSAHAIGELLLLPFRRRLPSARPAV